MSKTLLKYLLMLLMTSILIPTLVIAGIINLPKTGQTKCYNAEGNEISCSGTGQDGEKQVGESAPYPRFSGLGDCLFDNLTGLMWPKNADLAGGTLTWQGGLDYIANLNRGNGVCGYKDWRMPNINELKSLYYANYNNELCPTNLCDEFGKWLQTQGFTNVRYRYWSSTTHPGETYKAFYMQTDKGEILYHFKDSYQFAYVLPVRAGQSGMIETPYPSNIAKTGQNKCYDQNGVEINCAGTGQDGELQRGVTWPGNRFEVVGNDCILDNLTGLTWTYNANLINNPTTWQNALDFIKNLNSNNPLCGYNDWRLPNYFELTSLLNYSRYNPMVTKEHISAPFSNIQSARYWTSTTDPYRTSYAWAVGLGDGDIAPGDKNSVYTNYYLWPVRSELCSYTINPISANYSKSDNTGTISISTSKPSCNWTTGSDVNWITIVSGSSGSGNGSVIYSLSENTTGALRTGTITVGGQIHTVSQTDTVFTDVDSSMWSKNYILALYNNQITNGCIQNPLTYCPRREVTRGEMAAFIIRARFGHNFPHTQTPYFSDVPAGHTFFKYVQKMKDEGITRVDNIYGVDEKVTRGQMAAFIIRAKYGDNFTNSPTPYFSDVPTNHTFFNYVQKLKEDNITTQTGIYRVDDPVSREEMAAFISRAFLGMQ